jgi:hypothetical protein
MTHFSTVLSVIRARRWWIGLVVLAAIIVAVAAVTLTGGHRSEETDGRVRTIREAPPGMGQRFGTADTWLGKVAGKEYTVFAGASERPPSSGKAYRSELRVYEVTESGPPLLDGEYNPPGDGRELLKIVSARGAVLKLETRPGTYLYFDMARRTFVNK